MIEGSGRLGTFTTLIEFELYGDLILHSLPPLFNKQTSKLTCHGQKHTQVELICLRMLEKNERFYQARKVAQPTESCSKDVKLLKARGGRLVGTQLKLNKG